MTFESTKNLVIFTAVFLLDGGGFFANASDDWSYSGENGPDTWSGECNTGEFQSPINIVTDDAIKTDLSSLRFTRYDFAFTANVTNTGHTIQIETVGVPVHLKSSGLPHTYVLAQMHFHWGSEHTINGVQDAMELHFVHYAKQYDNTTYAAEFENGIAVVAVLFEISNQDNEYLEPIIASVKNVSSASSQLVTRLETKLIPSLLLPKDHSSYYRYHGSLTTPDCQEAVIWSVLSNKLTISVSQLEVFRKLESGVNETLAYNNRPIQSLGSRQVYHHLDGYSSAENITPKTILVFVSFVTMIWHGRTSP